MTGEHGGCCHHDDQHDKHDHRDAGAHAVLTPAATESAGCCGGKATHDDTSPSNEHAQRSESARSSS
jgi:hypothetical protein